MPLIANLRPLDNNRANRLLIAFSTCDKIACDVVLDETMHDPIGVPGLIFAMAQFATTLGEQIADDFVDQLRAALLAAENDQ